MSNVSKVYTVSTVSSEPYLSLQLGNQGETRYVGFIKDLMDELTKRIGITYQFKLADDRQYGQQTPTGWTGVIGEVISGRADIGAAALTITPAREEVVDFTKPFLSTGVNLLIQKPQRLDIGLGYLVRPFSTDFWMLLLIAILIVGFLFFLIGRFSPYEWIKVAEERDQRGARNAFSLRNSYLFVLSSVTWQGFREPPRSISGRFLAAFWWIFVLFTIVAYTSNLTAFLLARPEQLSLVPFKTYQDLLEANDIAVGALAFGSTQDELRKSRDSTLQNLWNKMSRQNSFVTDTESGVTRVRKSNGHFVMFLESTTAEYAARRNCDTMLFGTPIFQRGYGLATRKGEALGELLDKALVDLRERGDLQLLIDRWWRFAGECSDIDGRKQSLAATFPIYPISLRDMAVAILLLFLGIIVAIVFLVIEIIYHTIATKGKLEKPKMLNKKIFRAPKFTKGKSSKAAASPSDAEAGVSEPLSDEALEGTSGEGASTEGIDEAKEG